jgi:hypothetical protein
MNIILLLLGINHQLSGTRRDNMVDCSVRLVLTAICSWYELPLCSISYSCQQRDENMKMICEQFRSKRRFRFEKFWTKLEGFAEVVEGSWGASEAAATSPDPLRRLDRKLRKLARDLQR